MVVVVLLSIGYVVGVLFFSDKLLPLTTINDIPFGGKDLQFVKQKIDKISSDKLTIKAKDDVTVEIPLADIEYTESFDMEKLNNIKAEQNRLLWPVKMIGKKNYDVTPAVNYSEVKLARLVDELDIVNGNSVINPKDAYIKIDGGKYELVPEVVGNKLNVDLLKRVVNDAVSKGIDNIDLLETDCYIAPKIYSDSPDIQSTIKKLDKLSKLNLIYDFDDRQVVVTYETIVPWLIYENGKLEIDAEQARKFIEGLAGEFDTLRTNRQFQTTNFGIMTVGGGNYGWQIDVNTSTEKLMAAIDEGESVTMQPSYTTYGFSRKTDDIGDTYVEIDLTTQHIWFYKNGELFLDTPTVSGKPDGERDTPTGVFKLLSRETDRFLTGEDYKLHVDFWLPITWAGVGIHDSYWQPVYGGDRYITHGSHGCLNTPRDKVELLYNNLEIGTPVIVYKSPVKTPEELAAEEAAKAEEAAANVGDATQENNTPESVDNAAVPADTAPASESSNDTNFGTQFQFNIDDYVPVG